MTTIVELMTAVHRSCDEGLASLESAVSNGSWTEALQKWADFLSEISLHLAREERVLFPSFEQATGMTAGPTAVMRMEHEQMRSLFSQLGKAVDARDGARFLVLSETLMVLIQQHNMKEEQMLYPMCDRALPDAGSVISKIEMFVDEGNPSGCGDGKSAP